MDRANCVDETRIVDSSGKSNKSAELLAGRALLKADLAALPCELLNTLEQMDSRNLQRAFGKSEDRQKADPATAHCQFKIWTDQGGYKRQEPQRSVSNIHRSCEARNGYSGNTQKVWGQILNRDETQTVEHWVNHLVTLILNYLQHLAADRKALASLITDVEQGPTLDQLEQVDDQPPIVDAAIVSLVAAPAAPPRLLTAA
jgi:hypothetical protein